MWAVYMYKPVNCDTRVYATRVPETPATERRDLVIGTPEFYCVGWGLLSSHFSWGPFTPTEGFSGFIHKQIYHHALLLVSPHVLSYAAVCTINFNIKTFCVLSTDCVYVV